MFKFFLNKIEIAESPSGWESLTTTVRFDKELKGLFTIMDVTLTFFADGYQMIKNAYDTYGYCHEMTFEIQQFSDDLNYYVTAYTGTLFMKDVEFSVGIENEKQVGSAKCQINDNSFFARIKNNRNLKAKIYVPSSKNNVTITAAPYQKIEYFSPVTGSYYPTFLGPTHTRNNTAFRVWDALKFFVDFMSDGEMDFYSDAFDTGGMYDGYMISNGYLARFAQPGGVTQELFENHWMEMSFAELFTELDKQFNIGFIAGFDGNRAYLRIENLSYLYPNIITESLPDCDKVKTKAASEYLYDKLIIGSDIIQTDNAVSSGPADIRLLWFKREEYSIAGNCNTERSLELVNSWIVDSNTIEDNVENPNTVPKTNDDKFTLIKCTFISGTSWAADKSNWITGAATPVFYNELLNNNNKATRWYGAIPNDIAIQLGAVNNKFTAQSTSTATAGNNGAVATAQDINPMPVQVEISDAGSNYDPSTYDYTIPNGGVYTFNVNANFKLLDNNPGSGLPSCQSTVRIYLVNTTTSLQTLIYDQTTNQACNSTRNVNATGSINGATNDVIRLRVYFIGFFNANLGGIGSNVRLLPGLVWKCVATADGGGVYKEYDPRDYPINRSEIKKYPYTFDDFRAIQADPRGLFEFYVADERSRYGHLEEMKFYNARKEADFTIISTERINQ